MSLWTLLADSSVLSGKLSACGTALFLSVLLQRDDTSWVLNLSLKKKKSRITQQPEKNERPIMNVSNPTHPKRELTGQ